MSHSPLPWKMNHENWVIVDKDDGWVADTRNHDNDLFIIKACNAHQGLVEALRAMLDASSVECAFDEQVGIDAVAKAKKALEGV